LQLIEIAADEKADLIVVGTNQRRGLARLGSVSRAVLHHAPLNIACIPISSAEPTGRGSISRFKRVLVTNAIVSSLFLAAVALFTAGTPHAVVLAVLLVGGFFKSLEFTSINAIAYADIDNKAMSRATSFASVVQQLSLSAGVAFGALVLEIERMGRPDASVVAGDFPLAFLLVAAIAASSALIFASLPKEAGASLSARARPLAVEQEASPASQL